MKNRQFILGLILFVWAGITAISLSYSIRDKEIPTIIIHIIAIITCVYNGYKLIKKTI